VVTQPFHLTRAVWLCRSLGVDAEGAGTVSSYPDATFNGYVREIPAVDKAILDVWRDRKPTFPGPRDHTLDAVTG
jgi:vancomycin permeability regulator SanA